MVNITLVELHVEDGSFSTNLPFSGINKAEEDEEVEDVAADVEDEDGGSGKGLALLGVLVLLILGTAVVKYLTGEDEELDAVLETAGESTPIATE